MPMVPFHPQLTEAHCEFWFEPGADWPQERERQMQEQLAQAFPDVAGVSEPFLWFDPDYLAVRAAPPCGPEAHRERVLRALAVYHEVGRPRAVQTLCVRYGFELDPRAVPGLDAPHTLRRLGPGELLTLAAEPDVRCGPPRARLAARFLLTRQTSCLPRLAERRLRDIHDRMEDAFQDLRLRASLLAGRR